MGSTLKILGSTILGASLVTATAKPFQETTANPPKNSSKLENKNESNIKDKPIHLPLKFDFFHVPLSEAGKKWIEVQKDIFTKTTKKQNGGLIDASTFLTESTRKLLDGLVGKKGGIGVVEFKFVKLDKKENGYQYALDVDYSHGEKERWYISVSPYYTDQFPNDLPLSFIPLAIWKGTKDGGIDKLTQHELRYEKIITKGGSINFEYLLNKLDEAKDSRKSELADQAKIKSFDLTKNEPIGYIGLADANILNDPVLCGIVEDVGFFPELMNRAGYNFVTNKKGQNVIQVDRAPKQIIESEVESFRKKGVKNVYLKLSAHGNEVGTYFLYKQGENILRYGILTPRDLGDILDKFQDCKFVIATDACHNGGLSDTLKRYKDPSGKDGRIHLFTQSKISGFNQEGRLKGTVGHADIRTMQFPIGLLSVPVIYKANIAPKTSSSYYNIFFYSHILNGEPYGKAHLKADEDVKKLVPCDAGATKSTPQGGITTSMLELENKERI